MANKVATRNWFASANNKEELEDMFANMVSPENLYADGERSRAEANARYAMLRKDYSARGRELAKG